MNLKIIYTSEEKIKPFLDKVISATFSKLGFEEIGSGFNLKTGERDIGFEHKKEK